MGEARGCLDVELRGLGNHTAEKCNIESVGCEFERFFENLRNFRVFDGLGIEVEALGICCAGLNFSVSEKEQGVFG